MKPEKGRKYKTETHKNGERHKSKQTRKSYKIENNQKKKTEEAEKYLKKLKAGPYEDDQLVPLDQPKMNVEMIG